MAVHHPGFHDHLPSHHVHTTPPKHHAMVKDGLTDGEGTVRRPHESEKVEEHLKDGHGTKAK